MPSFAETLTVAQSLISTAPEAVYEKARNFQRSVSWKKTFDEAGAALLGGYDAMLEPRKTTKVRPPKKRC
jgi:hypothetical protein